MGKQEEATSKHCHLHDLARRVQLQYPFLRFIHIDIHLSLIEREVLNFKAVDESRRAGKLLLSRGYVATVRNREREHDIPWGGECRVDRQVRPDPRGRPYVDKFGPEELPRHLDREKFNLVYVLAAGVDALPRPTLCVPMSQV